MVTRTLFEAGNVMLREPMFADKYYISVICVNHIINEAVRGLNPFTVKRPHLKINARVYVRECVKLSFHSGRQADQQHIASVAIL